MSKNHIYRDPSTLSSNLKRFLILVSKRNNWKPGIPLGNVAENTVRITDNNIISYKPVGPIKIDGKSITIGLVLTLVPHKKISGVYLLHMFNIRILEESENTSLNIISGTTALGHYAKRLAEFELKDFISPLTGALWEIKCPANIEALFRAYDNVARLNDAISVFNLP